MKKFLLMIVLGVIGLSFSANAAYLKNVPRQLIQPNGDTLHCFVSGDEFYNYLHDAEGYTIILNRATGYYVYADEINGELMPSTHIAGKVNPEVVGLQPYLNISAQEMRNLRASVIENTPSIRTRANRSNQGILNNIVVFIRFADDTEFTKSFTSVQDMFNDSTTTNANSMYNYFKKASYNKLFISSTFYPAPSGNTIVSYQDINARNYYMPLSASNPSGYNPDNATDRRDREFDLLERAINYVKDQIPQNIDLDYNQDGYVDNICFIVKGNPGDWSGLLWPHRWSLYTRNVLINGKQVLDYNFQLEGSSSYFNNSVLCHEMFHTLGAPDLYHYVDGFGDLASTGPWDLMEQNTTPPQHSGAYMKYKYGKWIDEIPLIDQPGTYTLYPISSSTPNKVCYKIASADPDEFYVLEYREKNGTYFDSAIPGSGILIYRINTDCNTNGICSGNAQYNGADVLDEVYLFRPNGSPGVNGNINNAYLHPDAGRVVFDSTTNPYPFLSNGIKGLLNISNITAAGDSMQFTFNFINQLSVDTSQLHLPNQIDSAISFVINSNTNWSIQRSGSWYSLNKSSGSQNDTIVLTVRVLNPSEDLRRDTLKIIAPSAPAQYIYISQDGVSFGVSTDLVNFTVDGGTEEIIITSGTSWMITGSSDWFSYNKTSGNGNDTVKLTVLPNPGASRSYVTNVFSSEITKNIRIVQEGSSSVSSYDDDVRIFVYPNPVEDVLYISNEHNTDIQIKNISLFNMNGALVYSKDLHSVSAELNMSRYKSGIYMLRVLFPDHKTATYKIIKL